MIFPVLRWHRHGTGTRSCFHTHYPPAAALALAFSGAAPRVARPVPPMCSTCTLAYLRPTGVALLPTALTSYNHPHSP